jgi:hypothetical protein
MNDSPGWASPGSSPSDDPDREGSEASAEDGAPATWSKQQPPPGQWSAPGGSSGFGGAAPPAPAGWQQHPAGGGGPGWGAPSGWQQPTWGRPASPKPGVIPLRPLGVGEILDGAVSTMRAHWRTVLGVAFVVALVGQGAIVLVEGLGVFGDSALNAVAADPGATAGELVDAFSSLLAARSVALVITLLGVVVATAVLTMVTSRAVLGRPVTTREAWADARPQLLRLFGLTGLLLLIGGSVLAVCVAPGVLVAVGGAGAAGAGLILVGGVGGFVLLVWLLIRLCLASPALMLEKQGIVKAMKRSVKLVRGSWWRVLGIQLLTAVLVYIVMSIIQIPFILVGAAASPDGLRSLSSGAVGWSFLIITGAGAVIGSTITLPISAGVTALLYIDQRIRREALDLELARAAGVPGFDMPSPAPDAPGSTDAPNAPGTASPTGNVGTAGTTGTGSTVDTREPAGTVDTKDTKGTTDIADVAGPADAAGNGGSAGNGGGAGDGGGGNAAAGG